MAVNKGKLIEYWFSKRPNKYNLLVLNWTPTNIQV